MLIECPHCGEYTRDTTGYCLACGEKLSKISSRVETNPILSSQTEALIDTRPELFKLCPVCKHETPRGITACTNCGVDLEIARSNALSKLLDDAHLNSSDKSPEPSSSEFWPGLTYVAIGFVVHLVANVLIYSVEDFIAFLFLFLVYTFFLTYISTLGRYNKVTFFGFMNLFIWSLVPVVNWAVVFYFGRGLHMVASKKRLKDPPIATSLGAILSALGVIGIVFFLFLDGQLTGLTTAPTPRPTPTKIVLPTSSNPIAFGPGSQLDATVLEVTSHDIIYPGGDSAWYPTEGKIFLDLFILVKHKNSGLVSVEWKVIGITEKSGASWYPAFVSVKEDGPRPDPDYMQLVDVNGEESLLLDDVTYLRMIFSVDNIRQDISLEIAGVELATFHFTP